MKNLNDIGMLALASRLRRLHEVLQKEVKEAYGGFQFNFDPKWFAVVYALIENKRMSITDLSQFTGLAHTSIIQIVKDLQKKGWLISESCTKDGRVRLLRLTDAAIQKVPVLQQIWGDMRQAMEQINDEGQVDFWSGIQEFEASLDKKSFCDRVFDIKNNRESSSIKPLFPGPWFERKFDFAHLSTTPGVLLERLRYTHLRLKDQVKHLTESKVSDQDTKWSIKQNIGHLADLEPLWYGRVKDILSGEEVMRPADLSNKKTNEADHNYVDIEKLIADFYASRMQFVQLCQKNADKLALKSSLHPRLMKPMRIMDLMYFVAEHDDHHLATINYLIHKN